MTTKQTGDSSLLRNGRTALVAAAVLAVGAPTIRAQSGIVETNTPPRIAARSAPADDQRDGEGKIWAAVGGAAITSAFIITAVARGFRKDKRE
jgi:hypothetical protein